jgi:circadian clock protein KaiC
MASVAIGRIDQSRRTMNDPIFAPESPGRALEKAPTGITGLDEITFGGLPRGRPTLVTGGTGCGKTLLAMEFLLRGALEYGEPGVFIAFEETVEDLQKNVASLGFDLAQLEADGKIVVDHVELEKSQIAEAGEFDLEGLFIRIQFAAESIGAKRVAIDTLEVLFGGFTNQNLLRAEVRRLFRFLKDRQLTAVVTAERGEGKLTRQGIEEFVSDCVLFLDHRVEEGISTRRVRVVKYRGSLHGTNEYPFLIDESGISVLPVSSLSLDHPASEERVSTGIPRLDSMMEGGGYFRGSSILVSGTSGAGKTSVAVSFANAACARGERCLYLAFEESPAQIRRNMCSLGIDLEPWTENGLLRFAASRPTVYGLEMHLVTVHKMVRDFKPHVVIIDPISTFESVAPVDEVHAMLVRLIDHLKSEGITAMFTNLSSGDEARRETTNAQVSSIIDTWLVLRDMEYGGERNRGMYIIKSRGMGHSNQIREFIMSDHGIELVDVYVGPSGVLAGSARLAVEAREAAEEVALREEIDGLKLRLEQAHAALDSRWAAMQAEFRADEQELRREIKAKQRLARGIIEGRAAMARKRRSDASDGNSNVRAMPRK